MQPYIMSLAQIQHTLTAVILQNYTEINCMKSTNTKEKSKEKDIKYS